MKRTERQHLKENELAHLASNARQMMEARGGQVTAVAIGVVVVALAVGGYFAWSSRVNGRAHALLAEALALDDARIGPPAAPGSPNPGGLSFPSQRAKYQAALTKFKIVADEYPSSDAGMFARYRQGAAYMALGEPASAATTYQQVVDLAGKATIGQMARLGLAEAQAQSGQFDPAIATFKDLAQQKDGPVPVDGVLMRLARTYLEAGKTADAEQAFTRLVQEFPDSPFTADARRELAQMKKT